MPRNESQEPVDILQEEEEVIENTSNEIEDDSSAMFNQPKLPATKKRGISKAKKLKMHLPKGQKNGTY